MGHGHVYIYQDQARASSAHWLTELYYEDIFRQIYCGRNIPTDILRQIYHGRQITADILRQIQYGRYIMACIYYGRYIMSDILRQLDQGTYVTADIYYGSYITADTLRQMHYGTYIAYHKNGNVSNKIPAPEALNCCVRICSLQRVAPKDAQ